MFDVKCLNSGCTNCKDGICTKDYINCLYRDIPISEFVHIPSKIAYGGETK